MKDQETRLEADSTAAEEVEFKNYFKYCSDSQEVIAGIFARKKIRFTQPAVLNDPLEFNPSIKYNPGRNIHLYYEYDGCEFPSEELFYRIQIVESQINKYGILALTNTPDSFDMWSKYANGHKGFLLELQDDFNRHACFKSRSGTEYPLEKVDYVEDYCIDLDELTEKYDGYIPFEELRKRFFYSKTSRWKHENEYRLVRPLADCPEYVPPQKHASYRDNSLYLFDFSFDCIASVTFGAYMTVAKKRLIELCCEGQNIGFFQAVILRNSQGRDGLPGNINLVPIDEFGTRSRFYSMEPHHFCSDINEHAGASPKRIANLRELPYYEGHEKVVAETLRRLRLKENSGKEDS